MLRIGLNPYGIAYAVGLVGNDTPRRNPNPLGLDGFVAVAESIGARSIEIHAEHLFAQSRSALERLRNRLLEKGTIVVVSLGPPMEGLDKAVVSACSLGAKVIRVGLTEVLCGDRGLLGPGWYKLVQAVRTTLNERSRQAADLGIVLAIENHQDFGSQELLELAGEAGSNVGICFDTGNPLAVGEEPLSFARNVAHQVRHVHLKDYRAQWTDEGYRLVRCAIGEGSIPFSEIARILGEHHLDLTASIEIGALDARHIRLFKPAWWQGYGPRAAAELGPCLAAARKRYLAETIDSRTPWESGASGAEVVDYEIGQLHRSVSNLKALGLI
ncbi:MAG TPA: sugar phosphate isomerase/epimerase [Terriglobia bacterium]|nr:sugar phosphate isomerase/epimerase [Terriglobia bacterium]